MNDVIARTIVHTDHHSGGRVHHKTWGDIPSGYNLSNHRTFPRALGSQEMIHVHVGVFTKVVLTLREAVKQLLFEVCNDEQDLTPTIDLIREAYDREGEDE